MLICFNFFEKLICTLKTFSGKINYNSITTEKWPIVCNTELIKEDFMLVLTDLYHWLNL